jgi:acetylornithine/succinyldiaminopimelate/putrescine aminotransferase
MDNSKELFLKYLGQTSPYPIGLEIDHASGCFVYDPSGKRYFDMISGFSVSNIGHGNPQVINAIKDQADKYLHTMVYGEYVQAPQVRYAKALIDLLPSPLGQVYFTSSGAEAVEGALKLARRFTGRPELVCFRNAYHGSTQGALSVMGNETYKRAFRPLIPSVRILEFNNLEQLKQITGNTAAVIVEPIQAEAGIIPPDEGYLRALAQRCKSTGTLLLLDEIQTGFGRTGKLFNFLWHNIVPDILILAKALGGGMPLGAFIASSKIMSSLTHDPVLGHLTTFGGHPVSCAAGMASLDFILSNNLAERALELEKIIRTRMDHPYIRNIRGKGLMLAMVMDSEDRVKKFFDLSLSQGLMFDYFLFSKECIRIAPPLTITEKELDELCTLILDTLDKTTD